LIDELQLGVGFTITNASRGLIDLDRDGSEWGEGFRMKPLAWLPHYIPALRAALKPGTKIMVTFPPRDCDPQELLLGPKKYFNIGNPYEKYSLGPTNSSWGSGSRAQVTFFFGGGASGDETAVASQAYANAGALAQQMVGLATAHDFIDGYLLDYEAFCADCPAGRHPNVTECLRARASCVPREAASLAKLFKTLSSALHAKGKRLGFATNKNGAGFEHWPYYQSYLNAGVDRLYEMGTYCNHTRKGGPSDRENVTRQLLNYPLESTAFGLGDYRHFDSAAEAGAWLSELRAGALGRASAKFMGLGSLGLDIEGFCDFLCSALLLKAILARFLRASPILV
jgi:hypothetical protein